MKSILASLLLFSLLVLTVPVPGSGQVATLIQGPFTGWVTSLARSESGQKLIATYRGIPWASVSGDSGRSWDFIDLPLDDGEDVWATVGSDDRIWAYSEGHKLLMLDEGAEEWILVGSFRTERQYEKFRGIEGSREYVTTTYAAPDGSGVLWVADSKDYLGTRYTMPDTGQIALAEGSLILVNPLNRQIHAFDLQRRIWTSMECGYPFNSGSRIGRVAIAGERVYAARGNVLYQSIDLGANWIAVDTINAVLGIGIVGSEADNLILRIDDQLAVWSEGAVRNVVSAGVKCDLITTSGTILGPEGLPLFGTTRGVFSLSVENGAQPYIGFPAVGKVTATDSADYIVTEHRVYRRDRKSRLLSIVCLPTPSLIDVSGAAGDTLGLIYAGFLWISPNGGQDWGSPTGVKYALRMDDASVWSNSSIWHTRFGWYIDFGGISKQQLAHSGDGRTSWSFVATPFDNQFVVGDFLQGPSDSPEDLYYLDYGRENAPDFVFYRSEDGGVEWEEIGSLSRDILGGGEYSDFSVPLSRGTSTLGCHYGRVTAVVSPEGIDTIVYSKNDRGVIALGLHDSIYIGVATQVKHLNWGPFDRTPSDLFVWRKKGEENWHCLDLLPGDSSLTDRSMASGYPSAMIFPTPGGVYATSRGGKLWNFSDLDQLVRMSTPYRVTVENGYGSSFYVPGDTVHIWSRQLSPNEVSNGFFEAPIDTNFMAGAREWHTTFIMPAQDVVVTAAFDTIRLPIWQTNTLPDVAGEPFPVAVALPEGGTVEPRGAVLVIGEAQSHPEDFFTYAESHWFVRDALARKFSVITFGSEEGYQGDRDGNDTINWNLDFSNINTNPDVRRARLAFDAIGNVGDGERLPVWILALGGDGDFAARLAEELRIPAIAFTTALPKGEVLNDVISPAAFVAAANDTIARNRARATGSELTRQHYRNGRISIYAEHRPSPLFVNRFARIEGIDTTTSQSIIAELAAADIIRNTGSRPDGSYDLLMLDRGVYEGLLAGVNAPVLSGLTTLQQEEIWRQLIATGAGSTFFSDLNELILDFFNAHRIDPGESDVEAAEPANPDLDLTSRP